MRQYYYYEIQELEPHQIFVFGSNLAGRHGKGAALVAKNKFGAIYGKGKGVTGQCFAIPTKNENLKVLSLERVTDEVNYFLSFAELHPDYEFLITRIGCGLAGSKDSKIAPLFKGAPSNCIFDFKWMEYLG
jgi:hypothetical protein